MNNSFESIWGNTKWGNVTNQLDSFKHINDNTIYDDIMLDTDLSSVQKRLLINFKLHGETCTKIAWQREPSNVPYSRYFVEELLDK